jgi:predicted transcriptional regulator
VNLHPDRRALVLRSVEVVPGAHLRWLERISRLPLGTLRHHLGVLVDDRLVDIEYDRRFKRYYPAAMADPYRRAWDALRQRPSRRIVEAVLASPPTSQAELARRLGLANSTLNLYARRLTALGVVREEAGALAVIDPDTVAAVLARANPSLLDELTDGALEMFDGLEG